MDKLKMSSNYSLTDWEKVKEILGEKYYLKE
jgi:hypothetical protein